MLLAAIIGQRNQPEEGDSTIANCKLQTANCKLAESCKAIYCGSSVPSTLSFNFKSGWLRRFSELRQWLRGCGQRARPGQRPRVVVRSTCRPWACPRQTGDGNRHFPQATKSPARLCQQRQERNRTATLRRFPEPPHA